MNTSGKDVSLRTKKRQMMKYTTLLFDLDGTLVDSGEGIMRCAQYALAHMGIQVEDYRTLRAFVGPPLEDSFKDFYGMTGPEAQEAVLAYRERYFPIGIYEQTLYPGVLEMLDRLKEAGYSMAIATSKMNSQADRVVKELFPELSVRLDAVFGRDDAGLLHTKADVILDGLRQLGQPDRCSLLMIGDRKFDIIGARQCGIDSLGVLYGYGHREELAAAGATYICKDFDDMLQLLAPMDAVGQGIRNA